MNRTVKAAFALSLLAVLLAGCHDASDLKTVQQAKNPLIRTDQFQSVASNGSVAVAVGNGAVAVFDMTGLQQNRTMIEGAPALIAVSACPDHSFVALDFNRKVWSSDATAATWKPQAIPGTWRPLALTCDAKNRYWVVGSGTTIAGSANHGATWTEQNFGVDAMFNTVQFVDDDNGIITGEFGAVMTTADGGTTWNNAEKIPADFYPYAALFISPDIGYLSGLTGTMLHTRNGGKSWERLANPGGLPQFGFVRQGDVIYSVGAGGSVLRLEGSEWKSVDYGPATPVYLRGVADLGQGRLLAAGGSGVLQVVSIKAPPQAQPVRATAS